jgi:predicted phosphodiesterase
MSDIDQSIILSPPVVQHAGPHGFTVSIEVSCFCVGRVEWGLVADDLSRVAIASEAGLQDGSDQCLCIPVEICPALSVNQNVYYRVVAEPVKYENAYEIYKAAPEATEVRCLQVPHPDQESISMAVVSDTHAKPDVTKLLANRIEQVFPDILVLNGDMCDFLDDDHHPSSVLLSPGQSGSLLSSGGWASSRPILYVSGNHDVRGSLARERTSVFIPGEESGLPYNQALRIGPLAIVTLDSGEDKPDHHPVFGGMADYEAYRKRQAIWLQKVITRPSICEAPFKVAFSHIPLVGLPGENDGTSLEGAANFSGEGAKLWLPELVSAKFHAVICGHTHQWRCQDVPGSSMMKQIVGGGPFEKNAALIVVDADEDSLVIRIENIEGEELHTTRWANECRKSSRE